MGPASSRLRYAGWLRRVAVDVRAPVHVAVVGAGIVGCAVAYELARRGTRVTVIERRAVGRGATQASAGVLSPYISAHHGPLLELGGRSLRLYDEFVARVVEDSGSTVQYVRNGTIEVALDETSAIRLRATAAAYERSGVTARYLEPPELHAAEPQLTTDVCGGISVETHGYVAATELTGALRRAAGAHGVTFVSSTAVTRVSRPRESLLLETAHEAVECDAAVIAAGSWSGQVEVVGEDPLPVRPVRGQLLHLGWPTTPLERVVWTDACYLVPWTDGSLLVGATVEEVGFDERATVAAVRDLIAKTCRLVPRAEHAWFTEVRVGLRPATADDLPAIGAGRTPGLFYATGHFRDGLLLAPLTAALVADLVLDGKRDAALAVTDPLRFAAPQ